MCAKLKIRKSVIELQRDYDNGNKKELENLIFFYVHLRSILLILGTIIH